MLAWIYRIEDGYHNTIVTMRRTIHLGNDKFRAILL